MGGQWIQKKVGEIRGKSATVEINGVPYGVTEWSVTESLNPSFGTLDLYSFDGWNKTGSTDTTPKLGRKAARLARRGY
jgi:hypothetical protein